MCVRARACVGVGVCVYVYRERYLLRCSDSKLNDATVAAVWLEYQGGLKRCEWSTGPAVPPTQGVLTFGISKPDFHNWARHSRRGAPVGHVDKVRVSTGNTGENVGAGAEQRTAAVLMLASVFPLRAFPTHRYSAGTDWTIPR